LVRQKMISPRAVLNASQFRDLANIGTSGQPSDTEDLFDVPEYLEWFNRAFSSSLKGAVLTQGGLPAGDRIVDRVERDLTAKGIQTRPSGGFNHYTVASYFASNPPTTLSDGT